MTTDRCLVDPTGLLKYDFGAGHPFKIRRLGLTHELIRAYGLAEGEGIRTLIPREATEDEALAFHTSAYLEVLKLADGGLWTPNLFTHGLGTGDNPVFPGVYEWAMNVAGASVDCAREILDGRVRRAFNPAGGLHHAMPSRASGFCHVNDGVLAIHAFLQAGKRVAYVDIDAHHGDGVQFAFYDRPDVLTVSIHQSGATIFPGTGFADELGGEQARGTSINVPLLPGACDDAYERAADGILFPVVERFAPDVLVTQLGADALVGDRVASLAMTLPRFEALVRRFAAFDLPWVALGGGGYELANVPRAWTLAWAAILEVQLPDALPEEWIELAAADGLSVSSLRGDEATRSSPLHVLQDLERTMEALRQTAFPLLDRLTA
ncbi:MAG: acetoin utilization protein AcuC [Candidatus Bipolaricaulota bacterium]|nr:MAG: acetoin utilization protein AcuC [Candidatus Bipolaricaulota bacterium]